MIFAVAIVIVCLSVAIGVFLCRVAGHLLTVDEVLMDISALGGGLASAIGTFVSVLGSLPISGKGDVTASLGQFFLEGFLSALSAGIGSAIGVTAIVLAVRGAQRLSKLINALIGR